jgi:DivIVA domain-containing protein
MSLSPDDIVGYEFRQQKVRGYDIEQVDDLLDRLADQVERSDRELDDLRQRLRDCEARLGSALETETALKRTLVTAQDAVERALAEAREQADELRETAERAIDEQLARAREEAHTIVADAQQQARAEVSTAREQRAAIEGRLASLRALEQRHRTSFERHLRVQLEQLEQLDADEDAPGNAAAPLPDPAEEGQEGAVDRDRQAGEPAADATAAEPAEASGPAEPPPAGEHGLRVRVGGSQRPASGEHQLGSVPPPRGGEGEPYR